MQEKKLEKEILLKFSKNLRKIRNQRNFTQLYVSFNTGIDISLYQKYESNKCPNIKLTNLIKIVSFFDVSFEELIK
jgi:transcriptional regulator with XRE-family HTH domain